MPTPDELRLPDGYLFTFRGRGSVTHYASVSDSERRDGITDEQWATRDVQPLFVAGTYRDSSE